MNYLIVDIAIAAQANSEYLYLCAARAKSLSSTTKHNPPDEGQNITD